LKSLFALCAALLALSACSPESERAARNEVAQASGPVAAKAPLAVPAKTSAENGAAPAVEQSAAVERRCGWLHNPTPGNWWLVDRDGEWLLGAQGGYQAPGMDDMPDMSVVEWAAVNGNYGYGCACMDIVTDAETKRVVKLASATPKPLAQCRADRKLPKPDADE